MNTVGHVIIFGGTGFIGTHLTQHLLRENLSEKITLVDLLPPRNEPYAALLQEGLQSGRVAFSRCDVRQSIPVSLSPLRPDIIFNLAAVHREPGHAPSEYFETNKYGAENVCAYAIAMQCLRIIFTSSISPYGPAEEMKDETSHPVPSTPYGMSKLLAEYIHLAWQAAKPDRKLLVLRPGVVFGPGEGGNVTRLVKSIIKGYFFYVGNRQIRKAGGYVKELCSVIQFGLQHQELSGENLTLLNFSMNPTPTLERYVEAIREVSGCKRITLAVPRSLLLGSSYIIDAAARVLHLNLSINPVRVRKLFRPTFVDPMRLRELEYTWKFSMEDAMRDWKQMRPEDFIAQ